MRRQVGVDRDAAVDECWLVGDPPRWRRIIGRAGLEPHPGSIAQHGERAVESFAHLSDIAAEREQRWGPRTIDVDIITYDDLEIDEPGLTLPHPRLFERAFVLVPLAEIAPERMIAGRRVRDALAAADTTGIERLPARPEA